jgi:hypothetical protein
MRSRCFYALIGAAPLLRREEVMRHHPLRQHVATAAVIGCAAWTMIAASFIAPSANAATCPPPPTSSQVFKAWGDNADYALMPGGSFESALSGWSGSSLTASSGNEPWYVNSRSDSHFVTLSAGQSATTSAICEPLLQPVARMFLRNIGSTTGKLHVEFLITQNGKLYVLDGGYATASSSFGLSPVLSGAWSGPLSGSLQLRLTPVGTSAAFAVDDLYVDPYLSR